MRRYVTRERLQAMLDYEYLQCDLTLRNARGDTTAVRFRRRPPHALSPSKPATRKLPGETQTRGW